MSEYELEPVPGLPGHLPPDERMLWQGAPDRRLLARTAFHTRKVGFYFVALAALGIAGGAHWTGVVATLGVGVAGVVLLELIAWMTARATLYTITDKRIVMRIGVAIPKCVNLPLSQIASADLRARGHGAGDIALTLSGASPLGYALLWPHARAWRLARPEPMLRALADGEHAAVLLAHASGARARRETTDLGVGEALAA